MVDRERIRNLDVQTLTIRGQPLAELIADQTPTPVPPAPTFKVAGGKATITGTGAVSSGLAKITSATTCLGQDSSLAAMRVTATWNGSTITFKVTKPTSSTDGTPIPSTAATVINWIAFGS